MKITYLSIGDELLRGRIVNTNARMLAHLLRPAGFDIERIVTIEDNPLRIEEAVRTEMASADVLIISGGLGPTKDDMTKHTLASLFGMKLVLHQPTLDFVEARFQKAGIPMNEATRSQALVPSGCEVLANRQGTAPGMLFRQAEKMIFSLPGVPFEMEHLVRDAVLPRLLELDGKSRYFLQKTLRLNGIPESEAAERLETIHGLFPANMKLSYLPRQDGLWLEFQASGPLAEKEQAGSFFEQIFDKIRAAVSDKIYAEGDEDLPVLLGRKLMEKGLSLATAESLTAGLLAARVVEVSGSSAYYKGGIIAYETGQKTSLLDVPAELIREYGVVSKEVASAMAEGARKRLGADIGLATTGIAEADPESGTAPHAWIAVAGPEGTEPRHVRLYGDRNNARARCADLLLVLALKLL
ncbi:MAG: CinA family nicotinamide mononucleotide deamidase-related protein [Bacteroidia bacterium]